MCFLYSNIIYCIVCYYLKNFKFYTLVIVLFIVVYFTSAELTVLFRFYIKYALIKSKLKNTLNSVYVNVSDIRVNIRDP